MVFLLAGFGLLMLSSAGLIEGDKKFGSSYYFLTHQFLSGALLGAALYLIFYKISYRFWKKSAMLVLLGALFLMVAVFVPQWGLAAKGATRWLNLGWFSFQPAEVLKAALIIYFAAWFSGRRERQKKWSYLLTPFFVVLGFAGLLLALQPDLGTLSLIAVIALAIFFFAGARLSHIFGLVGVLTSLVVFLALFSPYQFGRFSAFVNRAEDPQGVSYHINQSLIAVGRGGIWGQGFGQSQQKLGFLPEPAGDSIAAVMAEELGAVGMAFFLALILLLVIRLIKIARRSPDSFAQLFVLGLAVWIMAQTFVNIAAISGLIPLTGITLPFVSYGGTSLAVLLASLGIAANIARESDEPFRKKRH